MPENLGIENLKACLAFICALANTGDAVGHDTSLKRWGKLLELFPQIATFNSIQWNQVGAEFADLDVDERAVLIADLKKEFDIEDDALEAVIEDAAVIASDFVSLFNRIKALKK